ncbi:hypothetical protein HanRHA438_Chr14g0655081 [Helianthus annuus]|nr:hypothetical protein HanRHA438_Chr14g0655081 [Helianthus annuus]
MDILPIRGLNMTSRRSFDTDTKFTLPLPNFRHFGKLIKSIMFLLSKNYN